MKKMIHIAAVPVLAVLLTACAGPGSQDGAEPVGTLDDPGPGGLTDVEKAAVEKAVEEVLLVDPAPGGLNPVQKALHQEVQVQDKDGKTTTTTLLQKALQKVLLDMVDDDDPFVRREVFAFNWEAADGGIQKQVSDRLEEIFRNKPKPNTRWHEPRPDGSPGLKIGWPPEEGRSGRVLYTVENLAGMTKDDEDLIDWIADEIALIPGVGENRIETPIRMDPGPSTVAIPTSRTRNYVLAVGRGTPHPECTATIVYTVVSEKDNRERDVVLSIHNGKDVQEVIGPEYPVEVDGHVEPGTGKCITDRAKEDYHFVLAELRATDGRPTVVHYYAVNLVTTEVKRWYEYTEGRPACPPSDGVWDTKPAGRVAQQELIMDEKKEVKKEFEHCA